MLLCGKQLWLKSSGNKPCCLFRRDWPLLMHSLFLSTWPSLSSKDVVSSLWTAPRLVSCLYSSSLLVFLLRSYSVCFSDETLFALPAASEPVIPSSAGKFFLPAFVSVYSVNLVLIQQSTLDLLKVSIGSRMLFLPKNKKTPKFAFYMLHPREAGFDS